jgi:hypothetical protein
MTLNKILEWCKNNIGKELESPRFIVFQTARSPQDFVIVSINNKNEVIKIQFKNSKTILPLEFWRFQAAIDFLRNRSDYVWLGTSLYSVQGSNLENHLQTLSKQRYGRKVDTKTASHIGDILVLSGIAKYGWTKSPNNRTVQGIKLSE